METEVDVLIDSKEAREILGVSAVNLRQIAFNHKGILIPQGKQLRRTLFLKSQVLAVHAIRTNRIPQ